MSVKKATTFNGQWAIVTDHERLPPIGEQIARARAWGVTEAELGRHDISAMIRDNVRGVSTTYWPNKLPERASFLASMATIQPHGDKVWFCTPLCIGFSAKHARETIEAIWSCGMQVYVHSVKHNGPALYVEGDDITNLLAMVASEQNATSVARSKARGRKS